MGFDDIHDVSVKVRRIFYISLFQLFLYMIGIPLLVMYERVSNRGTDVPAVQRLQK